MLTAENPLPVPYVPATQLLQVVPVAAPNAVEYKPGTQSVQLPREAIPTPVL